MEKWANKKNKKRLMKWRLYEPHNKAIASRLGADLFSFKKKFHNIVSFLLGKKRKKEREVSESKSLDEMQIT